MSNLLNNVQQRAVLIETYWNVKVHRSICFARTLASINRNILECKETTRRFRKDMVYVLIETYWNVKVKEGN